MAKFYGLIGYAEQVEISPSNWDEQITTRPYRGDVIRNSRRLQSDSDLIDDVVISNQISIVADPYANQNFHAIRFVEFMGAKWRVTNIEVKYPRLLLTLGGVYNDHE